MPSLDDYIDGIAEGLAKRAAVVRSVPSSRMRKQAIDLGSVGSQALDWVVRNPMLPGLALGAGAGGLAGYMRSDDDDEKQKNRNILMGALSGGALGGGLGAAAQFSPLSKQWGELTENMRTARGGDKPGHWWTPTAAGGTAAGYAHHKLNTGPGSVVDPRTIWRDPEILKGFGDDGEANFERARKMISAGIEQGAKGKISPIPEEAATRLVQDDAELSRVMRELQQQLANPNTSLNDAKVTISVPPSDQMKKLTEATANLNKVLEGTPGDLVAMAKIQASQGKIDVEKAMRFEKLEELFGAKWPAVQAAIAEVQAASTPQEVVITADQLDELASAGIRAGMGFDESDQLDWLSKLRYWGRKSTDPSKLGGPGTPYLDRPWVGKSMWRMPRAGAARTLVRGGIPAAAGAGTFALSKGILDYLGGSWGRGSAHQQVRETLGY
ncbi:MAG: hypothetical protein ACYS7M_08980 [Planctomycetota bacterium]|jgi:hypothetical protein